MVRSSRRVRSDRRAGPARAVRTDVPRAARPGLPSRNVAPEARRDALALVAWGTLVAIAAAWGVVLLAHGAHMRMWALPLAGNFRPRVGPRALPAIGFGVLVVVCAGSVARRVPWRSLLIVSFAAAAAWAVLLAFADGPHGLIRSILAPADVSNDLPAVHSVSTFLATFVRRIGEYSVHTRGHPPGLLLLLWTMSRLGMRGAWWQSALEVAGGAAAVPAVLVGIADVSGREAARAAAPFVALAPMAMFVATSEDALFAGVAAWAVALLVCATGRRSSRRLLLALGGGGLLAVGLFLSYGIALALAIPIAVAIARRDVLPLALAAVPVLAIGLAFGAAGFWWPAGLAATRQQYLLSVAAHRPTSYFLVADLAAFALALGPAVAVALARLRDRGVWLLVGGALAAIVLADVSGMSKGEVERIWLPFAPWVLAACCALAPSERETRRWLALQVASGVAMQLLVRSPW